MYAVIAVVTILLSTIISGCVYIIMLKNDINELQQINLINSKDLQEKDLAIDTYKKQISTYKNTTKNMEEKKQEYAKNINDIDKLKISNDKIEELRKSLQ